MHQSLSASATRPRTQPVPRGELSTSCLSASGGSSLPLPSPDHLRQHRRRIPVQAQRPRLLADLRGRQRLPRPVHPERAALRPTHDPLAPYTPPPPRSHAGRTSCNPDTSSPSGSVDGSSPPACRAGRGDPCARSHRECCPQVMHHDRDVGVWREHVGKAQRHRHQWQQARLLVQRALAAAPMVGRWMSITGMPVPGSDG